MGLGVSGAGALEWLPFQLLRIFLEIFSMLIGGNGADGRKVGSRHLQQWCFLRLSALARDDELHSSAVQSVVPRRVFSQMKCNSGCHGAGLPVSCIHSRKAGVMK